MVLEYRYPMTLAETKEMVKKIRQNINILEDLTEPLWKDSSECSGWKQILDYIAVQTT